MSVISGSLAAEQQPKTGLGPVRRILDASSPSPALARVSGRPSGRGPGGERTPGSVATSCTLDNLPLSVEFAPKFGGTAGHGPTVGGRLNGRCDASLSTTYIL